MHTQYTLHLNSVLHNDDIKEYRLRVLAAAVSYMVAQFSQPAKPEK